MDTQDYLEIEIRVPDEQTGEIVVAEIFDCGFDSFYYEEGVQKCYIQRELFDEQAFVSALQGASALLSLKLQWDSRPMPAQDWNMEWEQTGFTPIECGRFVVQPEGLPCPDGLESIVLRPQMAFGTGHHQTTFMMMESMQEHAGQIAGSYTVDLGCGSAVLAILAAKLGAEKVRAIDIDAVAVRSSNDNIRLNGLAFEAECGDASLLEGECCDVMLANIHRNILIEYMPLFSRVIKAGGLLFISGFLKEDLEDIMNAARSSGFDNLSTSSRDSWQCVTLKKKSE